MSTVKLYNCSFLSGLSIINEAPGGDISSMFGSIIMTKPVNNKYDLGFYTSEPVQSLQGMTIYIQTKYQYSGIQLDGFYNHMGLIELPGLVGYDDEGAVHTSYSLGRSDQNVIQAKNWCSVTPNGEATEFSFNPNTFAIDLKNKWTDKKFKIENDGKVTIGIRQSPEGTIGCIDPSVGAGFSDLPDCGYKIGGVLGWHENSIHFQFTLDRGGDKLWVNQIVFTDDGVID